MLNLRDNAFYLLGVSPEAAAAEVADAFDDAVMDAPADEAKLQKAKNALAAPKKRLPEELLSLWGVPAGKWEQWLARDNPGEWGGLSSVARMNLSAHFLSAPSAGDYSDDLRRVMLGQIIEAQNDFLTIMPDIRAARKKAGMPPPSDEHFRESMRAVSEKHCQAAMCAIGTAKLPGRIMTDVAEEWRYDKGEAGRFVTDLARAYDRWSILKLRPIEKKLEQAMGVLQDGQVDESALDDIDRLLLEWDEYSQPMQLMSEAKGLDDPRSKELCEKLRSLVINLANEHNEHGAALHISNALSRTFPELPGVAGKLASDVSTLRELSADALPSHEDIRDLRNAIKTARNDLAGFARSVASQSHECEAFKMIAASALQSFPDKEGVWVAILNLTAELFKNGHVDAARVLLKHLEQWANEYGAPQNIFGVLSGTANAFDLFDARTRLEHAAGQKDLAAAAKHAKVVAKLTNDREEKDLMQKIVQRHESESENWGWVWWVLIIGGWFVWNVLSR